ncbi:hypothetical protein Tco_0842387 [Tanacetum coccineum]|uniref:Reverse transcriptase Ty1/copia-type domain-containing protein n=1 Tax=Tanacetum coccineum TaxID=301880 RepID=A0ABQ5AZ45_9ASTR
MTPRSCLRWKPTGKIFKTVGLRWVPTGKIFTSSTTKVDSEPQNGSNADITNQYESAQTLDVSAGTSNLSAAETSVANVTSGLVPQRQKVSDYDNPDPAPELQNVSPSADTTVPSQQELDLLFGPLYDEFFNDGTSRVNKSSSPTDNSVPQDTQPSTNIQPTSEPSTPTNTHAEENTDDSSEIYILIAKYTLEILKKHGMEKGQSIGTPMATKPKLDADLSGEPYPKGSGFELTAFLDADHAGGIDTRKSTSGGIQFLGDKLVSWMSKKQDCTAMLSVEAETEYQLADMFTKALPEERFQYLVRRIGMRCLTPVELEVLTKESAGYLIKHQHKSYGFELETPSKKILFMNLPDHMYNIYSVKWSYEPRIHIKDEDVMPYSS